MIYYVIVSEELQVTINYPYEYYNDILRYYNVADRLHKHECIKDQYKLALL